MTLKAHFSRALAADPERLHFAAHSHHLWPDVSHEAQVRCWDHAVRLADRKWDHVFSEVYPAAQQGVARVLGLPDPASLAFAPNTHSLLMRLLSCFPPDKRLHVLTSDSEFHSFTRQMQRLAEDGAVALTVVPAEPFADFPARFAAAAIKGGHDLLYVSQVFYNSGYAVPDLAALVSAVPDDATMIVVDGYHGFLALPTDIRPIADRAFYIAGGYKYAMAGEGVCFLHAPPRYAPRPRDTGWYAAFGTLQHAGGTSVPYATDGSRFLGATFDPVGLYRMGAVLAWLEAQGLDAAKIHTHSHALQTQCIEGLDALDLKSLRPDQLVVPLSNTDRGNFLTFRTPEAGALHDRLLEANIVTDCRADRLRFGFGLYQDADDVAKLCARLRDCLG